MFDMPETAPPPPDPLPGAAPPAQPAPDPERAARKKKFEREQAIVDCLNRGLSVAEIAQRFDVGEKRMRAIVREIIARRQPHPPEDFVAIQVSRLNEALLVAYSAMAPDNLKAVAEVRRLVHALDRYHGFSGVVRSMPLVADPAPAVEARAAFGAAFVCRAEFAPHALDAFGGPRAEPEIRPEIPPQDVEKADSAPGKAHHEGHEDPQSLRASSCPSCPSWSIAAPREHGLAPAASLAAEPEIRPEVPPQPPEKSQSTPGKTHHEGHEDPQSLRASSCPWWLISPQPDGVEPGIRLQGSG